MRTTTDLLTPRPQPGVWRLEDLLGSDDDAFLAALRFELQLCRFSRERALDLATSEKEALSVVTRIRRDQIGFLHWRSLSAPDLSSPKYTVRPVPPATASVINRRFHYIGTPRDGFTLGLYPQPGGELPPAVSMTFSRLDVRSLAALLPPAAPPSSVLILSRVYTFSWAVPNSFSFAFRRAVAWLQQNLSGVRLLLTYVNPNLGFTGASYRAANWLGFARERTRYHYLDGEYVTLRELERCFGVEERHLVRVLGERLQLSPRQLEPLHVLAYPLDAKVRQDVADRCAA